MEQVFRIEIPIEAVDKTDASALRQLESTLQKIFSAMQKNKASASDVFDAMEKGANEARSAMQKTAKAAEDAADSYDSIAEAAGDAGDEQANAASDAANAFVNIDTKLHTVTTGYKNVGDAASEAGRKASPAFTQAGENADAFTKRVEKSNQTLRKMFSDKFQLIMSAIDRASPILKSISGTVKGLVGKTWSVAVKMKDFVTAPFRKIWNMINSPITLALSVVGVGFSASDVLSTYNGFESQMSGVRALTGATGEDFLLLKETAKELGAETSFSASQAAEGMQNLASAGFTTSEIVAAMPGMLDLAASSGEDLAVASDIAATTLRGFCLEASEAAHVADVLAEVSARTNATVADTGEAMKYIAPIANAMGLSLEETAAAIGLLSDAGIKGSQAGTTLRGALSRLAKPTEDMLEVMDSLGLSFYDSNGQMKSISSIVGMLKNNMASLTEEQKQNALVTLFGQEALSGMMVLMEAGPEKLDELTRSLENCEGAASEMSEVRLDNLAGDMEELSGAVETAKLELMEKLDPYLRSAVQWLTTKIPIIQQKLEDMIDAGVEKAGELKEFISGVFSSDDYQNADGFAEKFFVAWDKIIAEPFEEWWSSGGERILLGKLADFGEGAGELLNGIITGIFAAIQGKDIDFEGLNITGLAKAGAEAGKTFVSSFLGGLDIGNIFDEMPGGLKAGLLGFGAFKIGQGGFGIAKTIGALKTAFSGAGAAASAAVPAVASVGAKAATSAAGIGKAATLLGGLKTALTAIPGWGWVAAAALTAVVIGVKAYNDAQEEQRWALERSSTATAEAIEGYKSATRSYVEFSDTLDTVKELQLKIESSEDNPQTVQFVQDMLDSIEDKKGQVEAIMSQSSLTPEQISDYTEELSQIYTRRAEITILLSGASMTPEQVSSYEDALSSIKDRKAMITAKMAEDGLSEQELADLQRSYNSISDLEAEIILTLSGQSLTQEEIAALTAELEGIDSREAEITAEMSEAGMSEEDINDVVRLLNQIGDKQAMINVAMSEESMKTEDIEAMNAELQELYGHLVDTSGGVFTQADVDAGRITPEYFEAYQEQLRIQAEAALYEAQAKANTDMELLPQALENREQARQTYETYVSDGEAQLDEKVFLSELETQRKLLLGQYNAGDIDLDALMEGGEGIISSYKGYYGDRAGPINMDSIRPEMLFGTFSWGQWKPGDTDIFAGAIESVNSNQGYSDEQAAAYQADYERQNAAIVQTYQNQKSLIEGWTFQGTELAGMSLEEVAASYATLDEAGRKMFDDAVLALNALNAQTDYITEGEKTQAVDIVDLAAKAEVMQTVQTQVQQIATDYQAMSEEQRATFSASEEGAAQLAAVNEALSGLGLDQIDSLDQLNEALSALSTVDLSSFSLEAVQSAFSALGGDATGCKTKVDALRSSLEEIDGMNTSSTHTHTNKTINRTITVSGGRVSANANGGIYDGAFLSWVAEDGPEAIIPLGAKRRERGLELWLQAGKMLGVSEFAEGGIMAPYSGALERLPDEAWGDGEFGDGGSASPYLAVRGGGGAGHVVNVSVAANPTFQIEGGESSEDILDKLKGKQKELAEIFGEAVAEQLEDIVSNMV